MASRNQKDKAKLLTIVIETTPLQSQMIKKEVLAWSILIFLFCAGLYLFGRYRMSTGNPPFFIPKFEALLNDTQLMDSIGGSTYFEGTYSDIEFHSKDTLRSTIKIVGNKRTLHYNAVHLRAAEGENKWVLISDKLVIEYRIACYYLFFSRPHFSLSTCTQTGKCSGRKYFVLHPRLFDAKIDHY